MNSEELELSLRTEFESYLKTVLGEIRQEAADFQSRMEDEFDRQRSQFDEAFRGFTARFDSERRFDEAFTGSVSEHLRLARDEGARITAEAMAEAERLQETAAPPPAKYHTLRDAVNDISSKDSQSAILKSLVSYAAEFAPRGAFFIVKSEHFVGWRVFGADDAAENVVRELHFPTSSDTILGQAANSLSTAEGTRSNDRTFTDPLQFGSSAAAYAIPLVARGRSVAVLYADQDSRDGEVNREALETIVRVAGLTVELLAANQTAAAEDRPLSNPNFEDARHEEKTPQYVPAVGVMPEPGPPTWAEPAHPSMPEQPASPAWAEPAGFQEPQRPSFENVTSEAPPASFEREQPSPFQSEQPSPFPTEQPSPFGSYEQPKEEPQPSVSGYDFQPPQESGFERERPPSFEPAESPFAAEPEPQSSEGALRFDSGGSIETAAVTTASPFDRSADEYQPAPAVTGGFTPQPEPAAAAPSGPAGRLSDRAVDLPIEVPDDERRIHNDARRFARLLVSEIKLYNEKKVIEGRESRDLYDRLREAIDRSREMYDKRIQPPVAAKFDYFHYEVVNALAEGDADRLGSGYPGSTV